MNQAGRYEIKFILPFRKMQGVVQSISQLLEPDENNEEYGYRVLSLYYDSPGLDWFWDKVEGERLRTKMRVRIYPKDSQPKPDKAYVEIKAKTGHLINKQRIQLSLEQALDLCEGRAPDTSCKEEFFCQEVELLVKALSLRPVVITDYRRLAFTSGQTFPKLRITFDTICRGRVNDLDLLSDAPLFSFLPQEMGIMELKTETSIPVWLLDILQYHKLRINRMSKYCTAVAMGKGMKVIPLVSVLTGKSRTGEQNHG